MRIPDDIELIEVEEIKEFINKRPINIKNHFKNFFEIDNIGNVRITVSDTAHGGVKINSVLPEQYPYHGNYFSGIPIAFKASFRFAPLPSLPASLSKQIKVGIR